MPRLKKKKDDSDFDADMDSVGETRGRPLKRLRKQSDPRAAGVGPRRRAAPRRKEDDNVKRRRLQRAAPSPPRSCDEEMGDAEAGVVLEPVEIEGVLGSPKRAARNEQQRARRALETPRTQQRHREENTAGRAALRAARSPEQYAETNERERLRRIGTRAALTAEEKAAWRQARDSRHAGQGLFTAAAPDNLPSDA